MDWYTQRLLSEAIATDDAYRAKYAQPERQAEPQRELVFKTHITPAQPAQQQQPGAFKTPEQSKPWNDWARAHVDDLRKEVYEVIDEFDKVVAEEFKKVADAIKKLREETVQLRERIVKVEATNEILRGFITSGNKAASLTSIKGKSDAA
jgi:BMFP domain-containing protein YqiC